MKKVFQLFILAAIFVAFAAGGAWAGDYYVRTDGNDGNDGSANDAAHAWLTIQHAVDNVSSGDTIHVAAGTYNEATTFLDHAGLNFDATRVGIMLRGANAGIPGYGTREAESIIEGPNVLHGNAIYIFDGADGVVIDGFTLKASDDIVENRADDVVIKNNIITPISGTPADPNAPGIFACECDNLTAAYNWVRDTGGIGMFLGLASYSADITNSQIEHNLIENSGGAGILFNYASGTGGNTVEYNEIKNVGHDGIRGGPSASGMTIKHNEIYGSARDGVRIMGDATSHLINYNSIYSSVGYGVNNLHSATLDAECNWWGDASGPSHVGNVGGTGDTASDYVDYDPWLAQPLIHLSDVSLSGGFQAGHFPQVWDLNACDLVLSFTYDANGLVDDFGGSAHAWAELGIREVGYGNFNPTWMTGGAGVWLATDYEWSVDTFDPDPPGSPTLDLDDKLILQRGGGMDESYYDLPSPPPNPWANHRIWWDRDGVDPWQNDETANTGGVYNIEITLHATSATSGEAYMKINGLYQGFETDGKWNTVELTPAGMMFTGNMAQMQVFYGLSGYGATHSVAFKDIMVSGCRGNLPMSEFQIDKAKIEIAKGKASVKGKLALDLGYGDGLDISEDVIVTVGTYSETIPGGTMVEMDGKWEYKQPKGGAGTIKKMKIDWNKGRFEFSIDKVTTGFGNPAIPVTISVQVGDDFGTQTITMKEKKPGKWEYKVPK